MKHILLAALLLPNYAYADFNYHLLEYRKCSNEAVLRALTKAEALTCMEHYLTVKLHFAGVTYEEYQAMTVQERAKANKRGYRLFKEWEVRQARN